MCDSVYILFILSTLINCSVVYLPKCFDIWLISVCSDTILQTAFKSYTWFYSIEKVGFQRVVLCDFGQWMLADCCVQCSVCCVNRDYAIGLSPTYAPLLF